MCRIILLLSSGNFRNERHFMGFDLLSLTDITIFYKIQCSMQNKVYRYSVVKYMQVPFKYKDGEYKSALIYKSTFGCMSEELLKHFT